MRPGIEFDQEIDVLKIVINQTALPPRLAYNYDFSDRYKLNISLCDLWSNPLTMEFYLENWR